MIFAMGMYIVASLGVGVCGAWFGTQQGSSGRFRINQFAPFATRAATPHSTPQSYSA
jgi:hypothetical protein